MFLAIVGCVFVGWVMFDKLRLKTKFTEQEGIRDDYWQGKLTPNQKYIYSMLLDCIENPKLIKKYRKQLNSGRLR
jgi:late competence protein required for DNA uptake (superfamily II DNA/RNA helicase)